MLRPALLRIAMAKPEARSSHREPTPQGAGLAVVAVIVTVTLVALVLAGTVDRSIVLLLAAMAGLMALGFLDDIRPLPWAIKLIGQFAGAGCALAGLPEAASFLSHPAWMMAERLVSAAALVAVINLVNFVDGIDEITTAHLAPAFGVAVIAGLGGTAWLAGGPLAAAALGALIGFWPWNRHPARIFLGDAGSLPLGLMLGWLMLSLVYAGAFAAAALIALYPLLDGGLTLLRRAWRGARLTQPHRDHAYQHAVDTGVPVRTVAGTVAATSALCGALALLTLALPGPFIGLSALLVGLAATLAPILRWLRRPVLDR